MRNTRILTDTFNFGSSQIDLQDLQPTVSIYTSNMDPLVNVGCGMYQKRWAAYEQASSQESNDDETGTKGVLAPSQESKDDEIGKNAALAQDETQLDEGKAAAEESQAVKEEKSDAEEQVTKQEGPPYEPRWKSHPAFDKMNSSSRRAVGYKFKDRAFEEYAKFHDVDPVRVTLKMIEDDGGMVTWAFKGMNLGSQGPLRQALRVELRKPQNLDMKETYLLLTPYMQERFAVAWGART